MVKLFTPEETPVQGSARLSGSSPSANATIQAGRAIESLSTQYFEENKRADQLAEYTKGMNEAVTAQAEARNQRYQNRTDEKGNPTHRDLVTDIDEINNKVKGEALKNFRDSETREKFSLDYDNYATREKLKAFNEARRQQIDSGRAQILDSMNGLQRKAIEEGIDGLDANQGQAAKILETAASTGLISQQEKEIQTEAFRSATRVEILRNQISEDPQGTLDLLSSDNDIGLNSKEERALTKEANIQIKVGKRKEEQAQASIEAAQKREADLLASELDLGIAKGTINEADVVAHEEQLGTIRTNNLRKRAMAQHAKNMKTVNMDKKISGLVESGAGLDSISTEDLSKSYRRTVESLRNPQGGAPSINTLAQTVAHHRTSYKPMMQQFSNSARFGDSAEVGKHLSAYEYMRANNPSSLDKLSSDDTAFYAALEDMLEHTSTPIEQAVTHLRTKVYDRENEAVAERKAEFSKIKTFKHDALSRTIKGLFDSNKVLFGIIDLPGGEPDLAPGMVNQAKTMLEDAYIRTGSTASARATVVAELEKHAKVTTINGMNTLMFNAPEAVFPEYESEDFEKELHRELKDAKIDTDFGDIEIVSSGITRGVFDRKTNKELITYPLVTRNEFGLEVPVRDAVGNTVNWTVDIESMRKRSLLKAIDERIEDVESKKQKRLDKIQSKQKALRSRTNRTQFFTGVE